MKYILLISSMLIGFLANAQTFILQGQVMDSVSQSPMPNATVVLIDKKDKLSTMSNNEGYFTIKDLKKGNYTLEISFVGYQKFVGRFSFETQNMNFGKIYLKPEDINIKEVNIIGQVVPVSQKGDTTEMSAQSYKVNVDADALELVKKMPGITVEDGQVKAHGEQVKKVLVDGKDFFADDVNLSLQSIPSDMIDKVQVYNKLSDQSEFIGYDDGNSEKVMNIITRSDRKKGQNGKFTAGYGPDDKYLATGRLNISSKNHNLTLLGGSNNVNQQNYSMQDMFQSMGPGGGPGGRKRGQDGSGPGSAGFVSMSGMTGLNTLHSLGTNYSGNFGQNIKLTTSYFFNLTDNKTITESNKELYGDFDPLTQAKSEQSDQTSITTNSNHRINSKLDIKIDSLNSITYRQNLSFQVKDINSILHTSSLNLQNDPILQTINENLNNLKGVNFSGNFVFRHKFMKRGRTFSIGLQYSSNNQDADYTNLSNTTYFLGNSILDQRTLYNPIGKSYSANAMYTEPLTKSLLFMVTYNVGKNPGNTQKYVYDETSGLHKRIDSISNDLESNYYTQRAGLSLLIQKGSDVNGSVGFEYQNADLTGQQNFPYNSNLSKSFRNILPNATLRYKISKKTNIMTMYRASTQAPSVSQLQPVTDLSSSTSMSLGNSALIPSYTHSLMSNFRYANAEKFTNFGFNLFGNYTLDPIGNNTQILKKDTLLFGQRLLRNGQLINLVNLPDAWNVRGFVNYGFMFKPIKSNIALMISSGFTTSPGIINNQQSTTKSTDFMDGIVIASNISQYIDFTISYRGNYTIARNPIDLNLNSDYWRHTIGMTCTLSTKNGIVLSNTLSEQLIRGLGEGYNPDYLTWNLSLGKKMFKNKSGQLSLQVYDVLNQGKDVSHTATDYYISDTRTNTIGRYALVTFTYTLKAYKENQNPHSGPPGGFPPGGMPPGGMPPGRMD